MKTLIRPRLEVPKQFLGTFDGTLRAAQHGVVMGRSTSQQHIDLRDSLD